MQRRNDSPEIWNHKFVDRESEIRSVLDDVEDMCASDGHLHILSLYGMSGVGKSRLVEHLRKEELATLDKEVDTIYVTFELSGPDDMLTNLGLIRKSCRFRCPLFDYAYIRYWDTYRVSAMDESVLSSMHKSYLVDILDDVTSAASSGLNIPLPSASALVGVVEQSVRKLSSLSSRALLKQLEQMSETQLFEKLPMLLGLDIDEHFNGDRPMRSRKRGILFFDAYDLASAQGQRRKDWLFMLVKEITAGLVVVTSRERLNWGKFQLPFEHIELSKIPDYSAEDLLEDELLPDDYDLVDFIIKSTTGHPLYLNLALDLYHVSGRGPFDGEQWLDEGMVICEGLATRFISHLSPSIQEAITSLACIRVFDRAIFEHLARDLMLPCKVTDYGTIVDTTLCRYITESDGLCKLHDLFTHDVSANTSTAAKKRIIDSYVSFIAARHDAYASDSLKVLFQNIIGIEDGLEDDIDLACAEKTIDVFLALVNRSLSHLSDGIDELSSYKTMKAVQQFIRALDREKGDTQEAVRLYGEVHDPDLLGRHRASYEVLAGYRRSLLDGDYDAFIGTLRHVLAAEEAEKRGTSWAARKARIYLADCEIMKGQFKDALELLMGLEGEAESFAKNYDYFLIVRSIGHIYRFNMMSEQAMRYYQKASLACDSNSYVSAYCHTNYCETLCYCEEAKSDKAFELAEEDAEIKLNPRNLGKYLYSLAIRAAISGDYDVGHKTARESYRINDKDGYRSGKLFAEIADMLVTYGERGRVPAGRINEARGTCKDLGVYGYLLLPVDMAVGPDIDKYKDAYQWIDFEATCGAYRDFIALLDKRREG